MSLRSGCQWVIDGGALSVCRWLLVDDDFENRWALQLALESRGHHVVLAENGRDALQRANASFPALVITDFQMPEMDGAECAAV
ncbi:response regulator [Paraburkholderia rhynchosiae]|uniref:Regulator of RpoS n=1 Tax=Paraburkholderia rhynchosiae TaxID=487049 RepID=A0A6J5CQR8_9BURK|nr:response regulator [Paraburkholderia rhynchosiae]CAB3741842.1 Regulator of RpoS [Paraburkholderia rhynchosiae]